MSKKCFILVIEGDSYDDLYAAGPKDLAEDILPDLLGIRACDIVTCAFQETPDDAIEQLTMKGEIVSKVHPDNIWKRK